MEIPKLQQGQVSIIRADKSTGKILNNDNSYYQTVGQDYYRIFESLLVAKKCIETEILKFPSKYEYLIYNNKGDFVEALM